MVEAKSEPIPIPKIANKLTPPFMSMSAISKCA